MWKAKLTEGSLQKKPTDRIEGGIGDGSTHDFRLRVGCLGSMQWSRDRTRTSTGNNGGLQCVHDGRVRELSVDLLSISDQLLQGSHTFQH